ncbi:hypothetical protein ACHAXT_003866 [Thalassiosira profunda]
MDIYKGRLFTKEQCEHLKYVAEQHAYQANPGWIGMPNKNVPGMFDTTDSVFEELFHAVTHSVFGGRMCEGSLRFESNNEPHLVRYHTIGNKSGAPLHKDTEHKSLTLNCLLSDTDSFGGGGTYLQVLDRTIKLEQGEMLIHPGNLKHAGADIRFGLRHLLVAFLECEWEHGSEISLQNGPML